MIFFSSRIGRPLICSGCAEEKGENDHGHHREETRHFAVGQGQFSDYSFPLNKYN